MRISDWSSDVCSSDLAEARRAAVHHRAQRGAVAFTPGREAKNAAEGVEAHSCVSSRANASAYSARPLRSEEHTSELQSLMRISYAVFCLKKKNKQKHNRTE